MRPKQILTFYMPLWQGAQTQLTNWISPLRAIEFLSTILIHRGTILAGTVLSSIVNYAESESSSE